MNPSNFIKVIDKWLSTPVLFFLSFFFKKQRVFQYLNIKDFNRFLIIRPGGMGDACLLLPLIKYLKRNKKQVDVFCMKRNEEIFSIYQKEGYVRNIYLLENLTDYFLCRGNKYDCVLDTEQGFTTTILVSKFLKPRKTIGFHTSYRKFFYDYSVVYFQERYEAQCFLDLLKPFNLYLRINLDDLKLKKIAENKLKISNKRNGALFIGGSMEWRRPPISFFIKTLKKIINSFDKIYIIGSQQEKDQAQSLVKIDENKIINLCGKTNVRQTIAILQRCSVFIGTDSGPLHLAVLASVKKIFAIFGPGIYMKWGNKNLMEIIRRDLPCSPCGYGSFSQPVYCQFQNDHFNHLSTQQITDFILKNKKVGIL